MNDEDKIGISTIEVTTKLPVFICDLTPIIHHLNLAREAIDELRAADPTSPVSNVKAHYMSSWKSHLNNSKLLPLCQSVSTIAKMASSLYLSANIEALNMDLVVTDCWGIIYETSDYTQPHSHFPADFGCCVYLEADSNSAPIIFDGGTQVQPKNNLMVLFPGILNHEVPSTNSRRVAIAMNLNKVAMFSKPEQANS